MKESSDSSNIAPPAKRRRTSSNGTDSISRNPATSSSQPLAVPSQVIWMKDGNVILQAGQTQFRVHKSILSSESTVFTDMFELPQPPNEPLLDGCPVVHLSEPPEDVEFFLKAIYDHRWFHAKLMQMPAISAIFRLSNKYNCPLLRRDVCGRLTTDFPSTLEGWNATQETYLAIQMNGVFSLSSIALAHENNFRIILPVAYMQCLLEFTVDEILNGHDKEDGSVGKLPSSDQSICFFALIKLHQAQLRYTFEWATQTDAPVSTCCLQRRECRRHLLRLCTKFSLIDRLSVVGMVSWDVWIKNTHFEDCQKLCQNCLDVARAKFEVGREELWELLPSFFGLPTWPELRMEAEALLQES